MREKVRERKTDEREKLRTEDQAHRNDRVQAEGRALENSHEVGCRSGPGEPGTKHKTVTQKKVFRTLKSAEQRLQRRAEENYFLECVCTGVSGGAGITCCNVARTRSVAALFKKLLRTSWLRLQPSLKSNQPLQSKASEKSCQAPQKEFFRRSRKDEKRAVFKPFS